jgi:tetratricopeptide (TPR) repeat protein
VYRRLLASAFVLALLSGASAQLSGSGNPRIRVQYENDDRNAPLNLLVQLMNGPSSSTVATAYTNDSGYVEFSRVPVGEYHVIVTGDGIEKADSGMFEVDPRRITQSQSVYVRRLDESKPGNPPGSGPMVSAAALNIPDNARKEFEKGGDALTQENWKKAIDHLNRAIALYPQYAAAYNNLGVAYGRMNDPAHQREALEKAIALDDHFAPAYVNLAELCIRQQNSAQAESLLLKAIPLDPTSAKSYLLLADAQLLNQHYDAAISNALEVHSLPHERLALAHFIAARAYELENRPQDALAELQLFLKEEPEGPRADHIRDEIKIVQKQTR